MGPALEGVSSRLNLADLLPRPAKCMKVCNKLKVLIIRPEVRLAALFVFKHEHVHAFLHWRWCVGHSLLAFKVIKEHCVFLRLNRQPLFRQVNSELQFQIVSLRLSCNNLLKVRMRIFLIEQRCDCHSL